MCMNKFIMSPEFMPGALRNHKQTKFSRGAKPPAAVTARCARQQVHIRKFRTPPPQRDQPTALNHQQTGWPPPAAWTSGRLFSLYGYVEA